jgi:hypothetical protein
MKQMGSTEWTPAVWQDEEALIKIAAAKYGLDWHFVAAIRKAEGGGPGRDFGVLSVNAPTYTAQLEVCCQSVRHRLVQYDQDNQLVDLHETPGGEQVVVYNDDFIGWFGAIWAPNGAANDPTGLNANWSKNVSYWYLNLIDQDHPA